MTSAYKYDEFRELAIGWEAPTPLQSISVLKTKTPKALFTYWQEKKGTRDFPSINDIEMMDLYEIAPKMIIKDVIDGGDDFRNRFWGVSPCDMVRH